MRVIKTAVKLQDMKSKTSALVSSSSTVNEILNWLKDKFTADEKAIKYSELTNEELMSVDSFNHNIQMLLANEYFGKPTNAGILGYYALIERLTTQKGKALKTIDFEKVSKKKFDESNSTAKIEVTIDKIVNLDISNADVPLNATIIKGFKDIRRKFVKDIVHKRLDSWRITARKLESGKGEGKGAGRQNKKLDKWLSDNCDTATKKVQLAFEKDTELNYDIKSEINKSIAQIKLLAGKLYS